ncbi:MAG: porin family protein [Bacteroidia bacterium]|nr:porin family protein [Bacteroidia bacterium]
MKNRILYISFLLMFFLITVTLSGQKEKPMNRSWYDEKLLHFGFSLGFNTMDFNITPSQEYLEADSLYPEVTRLNPGINIQIVTDLHPSKYIDIRFLPGVSFGQRNVRYYKNQVLYNQQQRLESSFMEFPLLVKYKGDRLNNVRPYVIGGLNYRYDLAGKKEFDEERPVYLRVKRSDLYFETGAGLDFYLMYFKLSVELKMSNGIRNIIVDDAAPGHQEFRNAIDKMRSQIWVLAFHFE